MKIERHVLFWGLGFVFFLAGLYILSDILLPFIAGMALAYYLDPVADRLERAGLGRLPACLIILFMLTLVFVLCLFLLVPLLGQQILAFGENLPNLIRKLVGLINNSAPDWLKLALAKALPEIETSLSAWSAKGAGLLGAVAQSIWSGGMAIVGFLSLLVITPVVAFYLLYDWDHMISHVDRWLPRDHASTIRKLGREIDQAMAGFLRGQGTVCLLLGGFYALGLTLIGLDFSLLIGLGAGLLSFIPYVGAIIGLVVSMGVALVQFWPEWISISAVLAVFVAGQMLEGNFLSPKLVGKSVGLHPVWLMFALFAFGLLFGFVGLLVAVPAAAAIGVFVRFGLKQYLASPLYLGKSGKSKK